MKFTKLLAALAVTVSTALPAAANDPELTVLDWAGFASLATSDEPDTRETVYAHDAELGVDAAHSVYELDAQLPKLLENRDAVWYPFAIHQGLEARVGGWLNQVRARVRYGALCPELQRDLCGILDEMRLIKDAQEQDIMRRASAISARAHVRAMQLSARMLRAGQDVREYHLDAELLHEFRLGGSQYPAYGSIVAAGPNACVLHYRADVAPVRAGELVLIDAGCELDSYASDITRTFPADGKFTGPQRVLYDLVLASQDAAVAATKAGNRFNDPHDATVRVLAQGMLDVGLHADPGPAFTPGRGVGIEEGHDLFRGRRCVGEPGGDDALAHAGPRFVVPDFQDADTGLLARGDAPCPLVALVRHRRCAQHRHSAEP